MHPADEELVLRFQRGDEGAFVELVRRLDPAVLDLAWRILGERTAAEDVRQLAWMRVHGGLSAFEGRARVSTWVHRIVIHLCRDRQRRQASHGAAEERFLSLAPRERHAEPPLALHERAELAARVARAVAALPPREREVVVLRHYHDLPFPVIAQVVEAPVSTVKSRMAKGLDLLRTRLAQLQGDPS
jgi:RNA polymerase sigma-70 factor (ECF subfamily)